MIKDVVVNLSVGASGDPAMTYGVSLAGAFEAHLAGIAFAYEPAPPPTVLGSLPLDYMAAQRAEGEKAAQASRARFEEAARLAGLSAESRIIGTTIMGAADMFARIARRFDLTIVGQPESKKSAFAEPLVHATLFESGRPAIIVPYIQKKGFTLGRVMVCWDGGRTAARAIGDAVPFLERAQAIDIVVVGGERGKADQIPGADMAQHLARHGLSVEIKNIVAVETDIAGTILSHAADSSADLIVMGGYGHSRLREFILGGATRGILDAMTVPVLMSH